MTVALFINSLNDGGAEKVVIEIVNALKEEQVDIELICIEENYNYQPPKDIKTTYLSKSSFKGKKIKNLFMVLILAFRLSKHVKKNQIEIVQSHLFRSCYINILSKIFLRSPHIVQVVNHTIISRLKNEGLPGKINLWLINRLYKFPKLIISVSKVVHNDMQMLFKFKNNNVVIYNPFNLKEIENLSKEKVNEFVFCGDKKYVVSVGRLISIKRNYDLLVILSKLPSSVELLFIGSGRELKKLKYQAMELGISSRVYFLGWVQNPYKYIKHSDVLVCSSESESFGNTIVEAFICQVPVVSTDCGGPAELIGNKCGLLSPVGDICSLQKNIEKALFDTDIRSKLIRNAQIKANDFSISRIIVEYKHVLKIM